MAIFKEEEVSGGLLQLHTHFEKKLMIKQGRHDGTTSNTTHNSKDSGTRGEKKSGLAIFVNFLLFLLTVAACHASRTEKTIAIGLR